MLYIKAAGRMLCLCAMQLYLEVNDSSLLLHILFFLSSLALFGCSSRLCFHFIIVSLAIYSILPSAQVIEHNSNNAAEPDLHTELPFN